MFGELNNEETEALLQQESIGRIGCHADGFTYIVPVGYAYAGGCVYVHAGEGQKIKMMREAPEVCFEVDTIGKDAGWQSVIAWGTFSELAGDERREVLELLARRSLPHATSKTAQLLPWYPYYTGDLNNLEGVVCRIKLHRKTGRFGQPMPVTF